MFKTFVLVALAAIAAAAFLAVPAEAGHCSRTITEETRYCCSMGCDSPYNPNGNTCAADGSSTTEADIKVLADADQCSGTCSYVPSKTLTYCVDVGACPLTGCGEGFAEIKPENPRPAFPMSTQVSFYGSGFPNAMFKAHLHADTCENQGGAHFSGGDGVTADAVNENWPAVTCVDGACWGMAQNDWAPTKDELAAGLSIVVHDTPAAATGSGAKMLCADLSRDGIGSYSGSFSYLRDYDGLGYGKLKKKGSRGGKGKAKAGNMAKLSKLELATGVSFSGKGFQDGIYKAHLHEDTCANDGGGHYNGGDGVTVDAVNENWPAVTCRKGKCSGMAWNDWLPTAAAHAAGLSIVVHDTLAATTGSGSKMLCADLSVDGAGSYTGSFAYLQSYVESASVGYGKVKKGWASLTEPRMATKVHFHGEDAVDGIYKAHLHDDTCANDGGHHYNGGDGVTVDAVNENMPEVTCMDGKCNGMAWSGWQPAAGDVTSIVVHDTPAAATGSGAKMLCADLMWDSKGQSYRGNFEYLQSYRSNYSTAPGVGSVSHDSASLTAYNIGSSSGTGTGKGGKKGKGKKGKGKKGGLFARQSKAFGITTGGTIALVGVLASVALVATKTLGAKPVPETEGLLEYVVPEAVEL